MTFKARLDDEESRAFWAAVERGARAYDDLPSWQKGVIGGLESVDGQSGPGDSAENIERSGSETTAE